MTNLARPLRHCADAPPVLSRAHADQLVIAMLPWMLVAVDPTWFYNPAETLDPWLYHGFLRHYTLYVQDMFAGTYYGSRAAWLLPGHTLYLLFPPWWANLLLHVGCLWAATALMYSIVRRLGRGRGALLVALLFGTYAGVILALGWDYVDGAVITYYLAAVYSVVRAARSTRGSAWVLLAGAAFAGMLHANLAALLLAPSMIALLGWSECGEPRRRLAVIGRAAVFAGGVVAATLVLAVWSAAFGSRWDFFTPSIQWVLRSGGETTQIEATGAGWIVGVAGAWLAIPALGGLASMVIVSRGADRHPAALPLAASYLIALSGFLLFDALAGSLLQTSFYASWLIPPAFIAIALAHQWSWPRQPGCRVLTTAATLGVLLGSRTADVTAVASHLLTAIGPWAVWPTAAAVAAAMRPWRRPAVKRAATATAIVGMALISLNFITWIEHAPPNPGAPQLFRAVDATLDTLAPYIAKERPYFWVGAQRAHRGFLSSLVSVYLHDYSLLGAAFPALEENAHVKQLQPGNVVVIVTDQAQAEDSALRQLAHAGIHADALLTTRVETGRGALTLIVLAVTSRSPAV